MWPRMRGWMLRLMSPFHKRKQFDQDLEDELAFHLTMRQEKYAEAGLETPLAAAKGPTCIRWCRAMEGSAARCEEAQVAGELCR